MKKSFILSSLILILINFVNAQTDVTSRKGQPTDYKNNLIPPVPVNFKSATQYANFFEISLSNSGNINGRGIKSEGVKGCSGCNIAGKIMITPSGNTSNPKEVNRMHRPWSIPDPRDGWGIVSSTGIKTSIQIGSDGSWSANLPAGVYKLSVLRDGNEITIADNITVK